MSFRISARMAACIALVTVLALPSVGESAGRTKRKRTTSVSAKVGKDVATIDFFTAMKSKNIDIRFIAKDSKQGQIFIDNKGDKPVRIALPAAFAGVPVHAQFGGGGMGGGMGGMGGGMGGMGGGGMGGMGGGGGQAMGGGMGGGGMGGMGGGGMGGMGGGMGGGFFNVAPDKVGKIKVTTVCLEHGKPDPTPRMKYTIVPIEKVTSKPEVIELCRMVGSGRIDQTAGQAAAWHLANGLSWAELARKDRVKLRNGYTEKYFSPRQLVWAMQVTRVAKQRADQNPYYKRKGGKQESLSNAQIGEE